MEQPIEPAIDAPDEEWDNYTATKVDYDARHKDSRILSWWLIFAGIVGLFAATKLTLGKITYWVNKAEGADTTLGCDINPIVGCGKAINSGPGTIFGDFPNPMIGMMAWAVIITIGVLLASRVKLAKWHYGGLQLGVIGGIAMVSYLQYQSIYTLDTLCPYCMVTWAIMIPTFWIVTANNLRKTFHDNVVSKLLYRHYYLFIVAHFAVLCIAIWLKFGSTIFA